MVEVIAANGSIAPSSKLRLSGSFEAAPAGRMVYVWKAAWSLLPLTKDSPKPKTRSPGLKPLTDEPTLMTVPEKSNFPRR
jgi:hypothetical protein